MPIISKCPVKGITPYSEAAGDILCAQLGEIGFDSFEPTETGIKAYISKETFSESALQNTLEDVVIPDTSFEKEYFHRSIGRNRRFMHILQREK